MSIIDSIVFGIGTLPEAKIGLVKGKAKREMDSCRLYALAFNYLDLLFCQPVKLVDQGIDLVLVSVLLMVVFGYMAQGIDLYKRINRAYRSLV